MQQRPPDILDTPAAGAAAIRGGTLRVGGYAAGVALSVLAAALLTRYLGPADYGRYAAVISLVTILATIAEGGLTTIGVREFSLLEPDYRGRFFAELASLRLLTTAAGGVIAVVFAWAVGYDRELIAGAAIVGLGLLVHGVQFNFTVPLQAQMRLGGLSALEVVRQAATVAGVAVLVVAGASLLSFFWVVPFAAAVAVVATIPLIRGVVPLLPARRMTGWRRLLALTIPFGTANAVGAIYVYLAVVVLSLISTEQETGYFGAAFRIFIVVGAVAGLLVTGAFPILVRAARDDADRFGYALQRLWEMLFVLGAGLALCTAVGAGFAIDVVAGEEFEPAVNVLRIQSIALFATYLIAVWGFGLLSLSFYRSILIANTAALIVSLVLTLVLGELYGAEGGAIATVFGEGTLAAGYAVALVLKRPELRPALGVVPRVAAALLLAASFLLIPGVPDVVRLVAVALIYAGGAWALGAVPPEVAHALRLRRS